MEQPARHGMDRMDQHSPGGDRHSLLSSSVDAQRTMCKCRYSSSLLWYS
jgi:hypothetical protein